MDTKIEWTRIKHDVNGNPRYVCSFLHFVTAQEQEKTGTRVGWISELYSIASRRANKLGGRKYSTRSYGGGIVFQSYNLADTEKSILELMEKLDTESK